MMKQALLIVATVSVALVVWFYATPSQVAHSQGETQVKCGQIIEREFTANAQEHIYLLPMAPRESFEVSVKPFGDYLKTVLIFYGPSGIMMGYTDDENSPLAWADVKADPSLASGTLSATGKYRIRVTNTAVSSDRLVSDKTSAFGGIGLYTLSIGCTNSDGGKIPPSANPLPTATLAPVATQTPHSALLENSSTFTGTGFPGLPSVDFTNALTLPLPLGDSVIGVMPLDEQILGFTFDAEAGDTLDLTYTRSSGNMNLGLVVLSENNEVFFQASLVTSESLSTRFTLPKAGQYTIGIFRISLVEPAKAEPTLFQIKGVLNPTE